MTLNNLCSQKKLWGADTAPPIYSIARARKAAVAGRGGGRGGLGLGGGGRGGLGLGGGGRARWRRPITTHDTFISSKARDAQYSMDLPYVKSRQIAENLLVLPN